MESFWECVWRLNCFCPCRDQLSLQWSQIFSPRAIFPCGDNFICWGKMFPYKKMSRQKMFESLYGDGNFVTTPAEILVYVNAILFASTWKFFENIYVDPCMVKSKLTLQGQSVLVEGTSSPCSMQGQLTMFEGWNKEFPCLVSLCIVMRWKFQITLAERKKCIQVDMEKVQTI